MCFLFSYLNFWAFSLSVNGRISQLYFGISLLSLDFIFFFGFFFFAEHPGDLF